jgi:hypothetical protein
MAAASSFPRSEFPSPLGAGGAGGAASRSRSMGGVFFSLAMMDVDKTRSKGVFGVQPQLSILFDVVAELKSPSS